MADRGLNSVDGSVDVFEMAEHMPDGDAPVGAWKSMDYGSDRIDDVAGMSDQADGWSSMKMHIQVPL